MARTFFTTKARPYHTLVSRPKTADGKWAIEFGDYSKENVHYEMQTYRDTNKLLKTKYEYKIVTTQSDTQAAIDAAVAELNRGKP